MMSASSQPPVDDETSRRPRSSGATKPGGRNRFLAVLRYGATAWIVLVGSLILTGLAWYVSNNALQQRTRERFRFETEEIQVAIGQRMLEYEQVLHGGVGLFNSVGNVSRQQWRTYVETLNLEQQWPGFLGIGFTEQVDPAERNRFEARIRAEGFPDFAIWPADEREEYHSIIYLEPFTGRNLRAFGYDMFSEPTRRAAMERARATGEASISSVVTLVQETGVDVQRGFLMYLPVYEEGRTPPTPAERRERLRGFVYSPFRIKDLMRGILDSRAPVIHFEIYDGTALTPESFLYSSDEQMHEQKQRRTELERTSQLALAGHEWTLFFRAPETFEVPGQDQPLVVAFGGLFVDLLLFYVIASLGRSHHRAMALAESTQSEWRAREEAMQQRNSALKSKARKAALMESALDCIITADRQGRILEFNPAAERAFGHTQSQIVGRDLAETILPPAAREEFRSRLGGRSAAVPASLVGSRFELAAQRADGTEFPVEIALNATDLDGQRVFTAYLRDMTERKAFEAALRESEERYRLLVELSPEVISIVVDGRIVFINPAGVTLYGAKDEQELIGRSPMDLLHPDSHAFIAERNRRLAEGKRNPPAELKIGTLDGRIVYVESTVIPFNYRGRTAWLGVSRDVTDRKRAQDALREMNESLERKVAERTAELQAAKERAEAADRTKTNFLATMSHELRTPLNAIMGFTGTLLMKLPGPLNDVQEKQLRTVQGSARHLLSLINDLLDLAKVESGRIELTLEPVSPAEVLGELANSLRTAAEQKKLDFSVELPSADVTVRTDRRALSQILLNLTNNAIKFTERGSVRVAFGQRREGDRRITEFIVTDTGIGIDQADQQRLFLPFSQLAGDTRRRYEGTGLGLHLSRRLAELIGGRITLESEPGQGSTFTLVLTEN